MECLKNPVIEFWVETNGYGKYFATPMDQTPLSLISNTYKQVLSAMGIDTIVPKAKDITKRL